jgi:hypothetical protein
MKWFGIENSVSKKIGEIKQVDECSLGGPLFRFSKILLILRSERPN